MIRVDLGCGLNKLPGSIGVDHLPLAGVDVVADLESPLPFDDSSIDEVYALHVLEHVDAPLRLVAEIHRVLRPGGDLVAEVPHHSNPYAHSDPTHRTQWGLYSFAYVVAIDDQPFRRKVPDSYLGERFSVVEIRLVPMPRPRWSLLRLVDRWMAGSLGRMEFWERHMSATYPMYAIRVRLRKP